MQFIQANRDAILRPLQTVAGIVDKRHTLPILANILIRKTAETVSFLASDGEIQISTRAELGSGSDLAGTTVSARKLIDILRALPDSVDVTVKLDDRKASIQAGRSRFTLQTLSVDDFPLAKDDQAWSASFAMPQKQLRQLLQMVHFAMAQQDVRYYLNGLLMVTEGSTVRVVATDSHRLAYCETQLDNTHLPHHEVIIPRKTVLELQRLLNDTEDSVTADMASNQLRLRFGEVELLTKLVEGKFPDYQRVIPKTHNRRLVVSRDAFAQALSRASILTTDKFRGVRLALSVQEGLRIHSNNAEQEEAHEELEVSYEGDPLEIGFNVGYLQDVLATLKADTVQIDFGDANMSALVTVPGDDQFKYVVMPMRI